MAAYLSAEKKRVVDLTDAATLRELDAYVPLIQQGRAPGNSTDRAGRTPGAMNRPHSTSIAVLAAASCWRRRALPPARPRAGACPAPAAGAARTALDRYVEAPDPSYRHELVSTFTGSGYTAFVIDMTSQSWRQPARWIARLETLADNHQPDEVKHRKRSSTSRAAATPAPPPDG